MQYNEWIFFVNQHLQALTGGIDGILFALHDPNNKQNLQTYMKNLTPQQQDLLKSLIAAIESLNAALTPEVRKMLGVV